MNELSQTGERLGYNMTDEELHKIQAVQKDLIMEVDRICKKHGITYNIVGGTMLGAIRHGGYIPWDDDADIGFLRCEYEKFREACKSELNPEKYCMQDLRDTEGYRWGYGKLRRVDSEFVRLNQEEMPYNQGIFIDLMPFDNVPDNAVLRKIHFFQCFVFRKSFWSKVGAHTEKNNWVRLIYKVLERIPMSYTISRFQKFINHCEKTNTKLVRILTFPTPKNCFGYNREWYTQLDYYKFDELNLPGAKDYDGYLKVKYNDYMVMPPMEKRVIHPISRLKLPEEI